jgi:hypothetical protein
MKGVEMALVFMVPRKPPSQGIATNRAYPGFFPSEEENSPHRCHNAPVSATESIFKKRID